MAENSFPTDVERDGSIAATCCGWHLLAKPKGWRGHVTWCECGTLLVLREGVWQRG